MQCIRAGNARHVSFNIIGFVCLKHSNKYFVQRFEVKFLDSEVFATWSMALHMCIDQVVNDVGSVVHQLKGKV